MTPGQAAYEEWRKQANRLVDFPVATWNEIGETSQAIWNSIAKAAIKAEIAAHNPCYCDEIGRLCAYCSS